MRHSIMFILSGLIFIGACSSSKQNQQETTSSISAIPFDTIEKVKIDSLIENMHKDIREGVELQKIPYTVYDPTDTIYIHVLPNKSLRISLELNIENGIDWPTFYVSNEALVYVRYRFMMDDSTSNRASETITYLKDNKIIYCHERGSEFIKGQDNSPVSVRSLPYEQSKRSPEEIEQDYAKTWRIVLDQMKIYGMLPDYLSGD